MAKFIHLIKTLLVASALAAGAAHAQTAPSAAANAAPSGPVKMDSLRSGTPIDREMPIAPARQERDRAPYDRDFVQQPPLIPHTINGYQITKNFNKCMDCHAFQRSKASGATKVSVTALDQFATAQGAADLARRRLWKVLLDQPQGVVPLTRAGYLAASGG